MLCVKENDEIIIDIGDIHVFKSEVEVKLLPNASDDGSVLKMKRNEARSWVTYYIRTEENLKVGRLYQIKMEFSKQFQVYKYGYISSLYKVEDSKYPK